MPCQFLKGSAASGPRSATTKAEAIDARAAVEAARQSVELEGNRSKKFNLVNTTAGRGSIYLTAL